MIKCCASCYWWDRIDDDGHGDCKQGGPLEDEDMACYGLEKGEVSYCGTGFTHYNECCKDHLLEWQKGSRNGVDNLSEEAIFHNDNIGEYDDFEG